MKKYKETITATIFVFLFCLFSTSYAVAQTQTTDFYLTESNELPGGFDNYGKIELNEENCDGGYVGVAMKITPNHDFFNEGNNFGIQAFALNVNGDPSDISFILPDGWVDVKLKGHSTSEFGVYMVDFDGKGNSRKDPLVIKACSGTRDLSMADFIIPNKGYLFAAHIAGFYLSTDQNLYGFRASEETEGQSAWFASKGTPTFAQEISFTAVSADEGVKLQWTAISEENVLGYNIYRARGIFGTFEQLNNSLIYATGSISTTAEYEYTDSDVQKLRLYSYKLAEVGTDGVVREHGPVKIFTK